MSNYTKTTDFAAKDSLPTGDAGKIIRGAEFGTEFDNIALLLQLKLTLLALHLPVQLHSILFLTEPLELLRLLMKTICRPTAQPCFLHNSP